MEQKYLKIYKNIIVLISLSAFWGAIVYRLYALNLLGVILTLLIVIPLFTYWQSYTQKNKEKTSAFSKALTPNNYSIIIIYLIASLGAFFLLIKNQTAETIISPWEVVPWYFFLAYFIATLSLIYLLKAKNRFSNLLLSIHYLLSFAVVLIVYKIGYGFDPFIHRATLELIDKQGAVDPRPLYYLGEYSIIIILHKLFFIPISILEKFLVPFLSALLLPPFLIKLSQKLKLKNNTPALTSFFLLILPFSFFIVTNPQNLAYLFIILLVIIAINAESTSDIILLGMIALATFVTQPIAGIPAVLFVLYKIFARDNNNLFSKIILTSIIIANCVALPLAFYFLEKGSVSNEGITSETTNTLFSNLQLQNPAQENVILNFIYLYGFNIIPIIILLLFFGVYITKKNDLFKSLLPNLLFSTGLFISYLVTSKLSFSYLIDYEKSNYTNRILFLILLFSIPFVYLSLNSIAENLKRKNFTSKCFLIFSAILITTSLYITYPRFDNYYNSHGYSVSKNDITAVNWIENDADQDYIVLANQQVSAAALNEYGFNQYYKNDIFYYPIPTGAPLYQYYLNMVYEKPSKETMQKAMNLAGVKLSYFVINKYWWASAKIIEEAKLEADSFEIINNGEIYIFKYPQE